MNPENLNVLRQALPYINRFKNKTFVVKIGGEIADDEATLHSFCEEVALLYQVIEYYRVAEPSSPVPLLVERAVDMSAKSFIELLGKVLPDGSLKVKPQDS